MIEFFNRGREELVLKNRGIIIRQQKNTPWRGDFLLMVDREIPTIWGTVASL